MFWRVPETPRGDTRGIDSDQRLCYRNNVFGRFSDIKRVAERMFKGNKRREELTR